MRIPTAGGHSESVNIEFVRDFTTEEVRSLLEQPWDCCARRYCKYIYPMPVFAHDKDEVFVGRIRREISRKLLKFVDSLGQPKEGCDEHCANSRVSNCS